MWEREREEKKHRVLFLGIWKDDLAEMIDRMHWYLLLAKKGTVENRGRSQILSCVVNAENSAYLRRCGWDAGNQAPNVIGRVGSLWVCKSSQGAPFVRHFFLFWNSVGCYLFFVFLLRPHPQHMEVPTLGVESELHLPAYVCHNHSNSGSEQHLWPTPQVTVVLDP